MNKKFIILGIIVLLLITAVLFLVFYFKKPVVNYDNFAKCLTEKGIIMYGASWCSHCQQEKKNFGGSFKYINYIECPADPQRCLNAGVYGYPSWIFPDGKKLEGYQGLEKLSQESGCPLK